MEFAFKFFNPYASTAVTECRLPHWQQQSAVYFVTFRLFDSLPAGKLKALEIERDQWKQSYPPPWTLEIEMEYHKRFSGAIERWLDQSHGSCMLRDRSCAKIVGDALAYFEGDRCHQLAWVVMPNHVHALFVPNPPWTVEKLLHSWKSFTAHAINKKLGRHGAYWQRDYFDRMIRDEEHFGNVVRYLRKNPAQANLREDEYLLWETDFIRKIQ